jgi:long-subunit acyl-CoA synthetase (AMP-forming)
MTRLEEMNYARYAAIHARHLPQKICLIERTPSTNDRRTLTWGQFNQAINKVANYLSTELGVRDGDYVMHLQNNSLEWLITYYGIIKPGAVVVPLNFRFVGSDIQYAAEVCHPKVFTHAALNHTALANGMSYFVQRHDNYVFFLPLYHSGPMFLWAPFYATGATGTLLREFREPGWIIEAIEK